MKAFSGKRYSDNEKRCNENEWPCIICGRPVDKDNAIAWLGVTDDYEITEDDNVATMGFFPIGSNCYRKYRKSLTS